MMVTMMAVETVSLQNIRFLFQTDTTGYLKPFSHFSHHEIQVLYKVSF
jgi:hypothetical protein